MRVPSAGMGLAVDTRSGKLFNLLGFMLDADAPYQGGGVFICNSEEHRDGLIDRVRETGNEAYPLPEMPKERRMTERELRVVALAIDFDKRSLL